MARNVEPSAVIARVLQEPYDIGRGYLLDAAYNRRDRYSSSLEAQLSAVAMDPTLRGIAKRRFEAAWAKSAETLTTALPTSGEVIIGAGYHAAVYAATRMAMGYPRPIVLERGPANRVGGAFAMTDRPAFWLNSRNRPGGPGIAGDSGASLNYIPGGILQPASIGMSEFQSNVDMAFCIRATLAQYATVIPSARVVSVDTTSESGIGVVAAVRDGTLEFTAQRVIDARGLGDPQMFSETTPENVLSFPEFMVRMADGTWPLQGVKRVAVVGGGDSAKCAVESLLGLSPEPNMSPSTVDNVERIDWYGPNTPARCKDWARTENDRGEQVRGRYRAIGHYLRRDAYGVRRLNVINRVVTGVSPFPNGVMVEGSVYDLVVVCLGNKLEGLPGFDDLLFRTVTDSSGAPIAKTAAQRLFKVGPRASLTFTQRERENGVAEFAQNAVSMFRTGKMTASLAAQLPDATPTAVQPTPVNSPSIYEGPFSESVNSPSIYEGPFSESPF